MLTNACLPYLLEVFMVDFGIVRRVWSQFRIEVCAHIVRRDVFFGRESARLRLVPMCDASVLPMYVLSVDSGIAVPGVIEHMHPTVGSKRDERRIGR